MNTLFMPYLDVSVNAKWDEGESFPAGRPNPLYAELAAALKTDGLTLSFITLGQDNTPCWSGQTTTPLNWAKPLTDALIDAGLGFKLAFGGASNIDISSVLSEDERLEAYRQAITLYQPRGLDFDLENNQFDMGKISAALARLQPEHPEVQLTLTLPTLPSGLSPEQFTLVEQLAAANVDFIINGMTMDYFQPGVAGEMGQAAKEAAMSIAAQLETLYPNLSEKERFAKIGITPMIVRNDDGAMFTLDNAFNVAAFAAQQGLSLLSHWSLNRGNPSHLGYPDSESSSNQDQRVTGEYTSRFLAGASSVPFPTLPDVVQVVDAQLKTPPVDITSSPHWRAKEIEAAVASALSASTPAEEEPSGDLVSSAEQGADEADGAETPAAAVGSIAAAEQTADEDALAAAATDGARTPAAVAGSIAAAAAEQTADEADLAAAVTDGARTPAAVAGSIAAAEQADIPDASVTPGEAIVSAVATAQRDVPAAALTPTADNFLPSARAAETDTEVNVAVAATATKAEAEAKAENVAFTATKAEAKAEAVAAMATEAEAMAS
ncbi:hypothetical protein JZM24_09970 [Candidatus Sodalis endolongispinus]|uniref:Chitinase n=1 Tax=Candidatus Sodalis endolongispinus TaxID=2812662 RepID=A0ABS5YE21_9GAMM|nr:hypothetical protein [Candidatus Sodalis endolongispinus]MBT9432371.1 hypothetical protein [Candidatus Sodalis endolongispinus]